MVDFTKDFVNELKTFLKYQDGERDPLYWRQLDSEELPIKAIQQVFNAKYCKNCEKWKYKEHFKIYPENADDARNEPRGREEPRVTTRLRDDFSKGISSYCFKCNLEINKSYTYERNRSEIYRRLQTDKTYKVKPNVLKRYNIEYDDFTGNYVLF